jgi:hypothetical protein
MWFGLRTKNWKNGFSQKAHDGQDASSGTNGSSAKEVNWPIQPSQPRYVSQCAKSMATGKDFDQNGFTITRTTMIAAAIPGSSFMIRSVRLSRGRFPDARFFP